MLTVIGIQFGTLLGGAVLTERFGWPGIGRLLVDSVFSRDFPKVQGIIVLSHGHMTNFPGLAIFLAVLAFNLLGDGLRDALDPWLRTLEGG